MSTHQSNPTSRYSGRDDGQRGARDVSLGLQSNKNAPLTGGTRCQYCAYLSIDFLSTICPIDRPKVFLISLHVLRDLLGNTFAYLVVRIGLLLNRPKKVWAKSISQLPRFAYARSSRLQGQLPSMRVAVALVHKHNNTKHKTRFYKDRGWSLDEPSGNVRVENSQVQNAPKKNMQLSVLALGTQVVRQGSGREKATTKATVKHTFQSPPMETLTSQSEGECSSSAACESHFFTQFGCSCRLQKRPD